MSDEPVKVKVVINSDYGGFSLSKAALRELFENGWKELGTPIEVLGPRLAAALVDSRTSRTSFYVFSTDEKFFLHDPRGDAARADPRLVEAVDRLGKAANGAFADLKVIEVPADAEWHIEDYDGRESVHENHRVWE